MTVSTVVTSNITVTSSALTVGATGVSSVEASDVVVQSGGIDAKMIKNKSAIITADLLIESKSIQTSKKEITFYPSIKPTERNYTPPSHAIARAKTMNNGVSATPLASEPGRATLSLVHENITDSQAEEICSCHDNAMGASRKILLPDEVFAGASQNLKNRMAKHSSKTSLPPGSLICLPDPVCPGGVAAEYRWLRDGVVASGFVTAAYVVSPESDIKPNGSGVSITGQFRCGSGPWRTAQSVFTGASGQDQLWEFASPPVISRSVDQCPGCATARVQLRTARTFSAAAYRPIIKVPRIPTEQTNLAQYEVYYTIEASEPWFFLPPACLTYTSGGGGNWETQIPEAEVEIVSQGPPLVSVQRFYRYINGVRTLTCSREKLGTTGHHLIKVLGSRYRQAPSDPWSYIDYINGQPAPRG
jgi:hypothetical protein